MKKIVSWRPDWETICIEQELKEWDKAPDGSRNARFQRAIAAGLQVEDWSIIQRKLLDLKRKKVDVPSSMQMRLDSETSTSLNQIREAIKETSSTELKKPRLSYIFRLILFNYLLTLQKSGTEEKKEAVSNIEIVSVDGVVLLRGIAELLLSKTEQAQSKLKKIFEIMEE